MTKKEKWDIRLADERRKRYTTQMKKFNWMLGYPSHIPELDKYTSWLIPWKVYTIAGWSNTGKSRFSYWYINHMLDIWKKVVFVSLEVDKWLLFQHLCCNRYNVYPKELTDEMIDIMDFSNLLIYDDIYNLYDIEELVMEEKPDLCVIDFVQNIQVPWTNGYEAMATAAKKIQEIAIKSNAIMLSLSQINNETAKELSRGNSSFVTLKGAWEFTASSDVILLLNMMDWEMIVTVSKTKFAQKPEDPLVFKCDFGKSKFTFSRYV